VVSLFILERQKKNHHRVTAIFLFAFEAVLLLASWIVGLKVDEKIKQAETIDNPWIILCASLFGSSMGFQCYAVKDTIEGSPPTTVMTSTLINLASNFSGALCLTTMGKLEYPETKPMVLIVRPAGSCAVERETRDSYDAKKKKLWGNFLNTGKPLLAFLIGCLIGSIVTYKATFWSISVPLFMLIFLILEIVSKHCEGSKIDLEDRNEKY